MKLFETLAAIIGANDDVNIVIRKNTNGNLIVCTSLVNSEVKDPAKKVIAPFIVTGTPQELDDEYAGLISTPLEQSAGIQTSMENFEASKKAAQAKSQAAADKKKAEDAEKKAKKEKFSRLLGEADKLAKQKKWREAHKLYDEALSIADGSDKAKAQAGIDTCKKNEQPDIFSMQFDSHEDSAETETVEETTESEDEAVEEEESEDPEEEETEDDTEAAEDEISTLDYNEE